MSLFSNVDELLTYLAEKSKLYIDETIDGSLTAQAQNFQNIISSDLIQLNALIEALEDLSYTNDNNIDIDALVAQVALLSSQNAQQQQDIDDLNNSLLVEIQQRINILYGAPFDENDFQQAKYKTIIELSANLALLEGIVSSIQSGGTGGDDNIQSDWADTDPTSDSYIHNKPQWVQSIGVYYEWQQDILIRYDVYGDLILWKVERFSAGQSKWFVTGSGQLPSTLADCQILQYN